MDLKQAQIHEGVIFDPTEPQLSAPMWIIDRVDIHANEHYVAIYGLDKASIKEYHKNDNNYIYLDKEFTYVMHKKVPYGENPVTSLAKKAKGLFDHKNVDGRLKVYKKPIFTTVVTTGEDTFNNQLGLGFYEHEPTVKKVFKGHPYVQVGRPTGVFLSLDRITWFKDFIPKANLVSVLQDEIQGVRDNYIPLDTGVDSYFGN